MKLNKKDQLKIEETKLDYEKAGMFLHCKECLEPFLKSLDYKAGLISPRNAMAYEASSYPFAYPNGTVANIMVIWCKNCGKKVWDSRHMQHVY